MKISTKKMVLSSIIVVATMYIWVGIQHNFSSVIEKTEFLKANVEALTDSEDDFSDARYTVVLKSCTVMLSPEDAMSKLGIKISYPTEFTFGAIECLPMGNHKCIVKTCEEVLKELGL